MVRAGDRVFFVADSVGHGRELHAIPFADAETYEVTTHGVGCSNAPAPPVLGWSGTPRVGHVFALELANTAPNALAVLLWSLDHQEGKAGPCAVYLASAGPLLVASTDAQGEFAFSFVVPGIPGLAGLPIFLQYAVGETGGPLGGGGALSQALEVIIDG